MKVGNNSQDCELNLAPIIDCFTVLITFMLVSASFLSIGILDAGIAASGEASTQNTPPTEFVQIELQPNFNFEVKVTSKETQTYYVGAKNGAWDYESLIGRLSEVKKNLPKSELVILTAKNDIEYMHLIKCMEKVKSVMKNIILGGF